MSNPFKNLIRQFLYFSKGDRNAILTLSIFIILSIIAVNLLNLFQPKSKYNYAEFAKQFEQWENEGQTVTNSGNNYLFDFNPNTITNENLDSLLIPENIKRNIINYRNAGGKFSSPLQLRKIYGMNDSIFNAIQKYIQIPKETEERKIYNRPKSKPESGFFDPNTVSLDTLIQFGFNKFQGNNLINFRKKGGVFYSNSDLLKIYGIDSLFFSLIESHVKIIKQENQNIIPEIIQRIELNRADSIVLLKLKGIGPVYAGRIIKYRDLLGGFYSTSQLLEVYNFPGEFFPLIKDQISADTILIKKLRINFADFAELLRHPYLNKQQVQAILKYRDENGAFENVNQIQRIQAIDNKTFLQIQPYITCR